MGTEDDKRSAVSISIGLSGQLITAALAMLTVEGAYVSYVLDKRIPASLFEIVSALSVICFILSVFLAGKAITAARNEGFSGNWSLEAGKNQFNFQALLNAVGLLLFLGAVMLSGSSKSEKDYSAEIASGVESFEKILRASENSNTELQAKLLTLEAEINSLKILVGEYKRRAAREKCPNNPINSDKKLRCAPFFPGYW